MKKIVFAKVCHYLFVPLYEIYVRRSETYEDHKGPSHRVSKKKIFLPIRVSGALMAVEYAGKNRFSKY